MDYTHSTLNGHYEARLKGRLTFADHQRFRHILSFFEAEDLESLALNFAEVEFIDSAGLGMLLLARDEALERGRTLILREPAGQVAKMFGVAEFDTLFNVEG